MANRGAIDDIVRRSDKAACKLQVDPLLGHPAHSPTAAAARCWQGSTYSLRKQVQTQLDRINAQLVRQVSEPCRHGVEGRCPLSPVAQGASMEDFSLMFASGDAGDDFFNKYLAEFVDTGLRPWRD